MLRFHTLSHLESLAVALITERESSGSRGSGSEPLKGLSLKNSLSTEFMSISACDPLHLHG